MLFFFVLCSLFFVLCSLFYVEYILTCLIYFVCCLFFETQVAAVEEIRAIVHEEGTKSGDGGSNDLEAAVSAEFRQWLKSSGKLREVSDLLALVK